MSGGWSICVIGGKCVDLNQGCGTDGFLRKVVGFVMLLIPDLLGDVKE